MQKKNELEKFARLKNIVFVSGAYWGNEFKQKSINMTENKKVFLDTLSPVYLSGIRRDPVSLKLLPTT